jgi:glycosyltransferase involved in cell wall biosynthesis
MPWVSHLVGRVLSRQCGLPWVAHFSDPWVDSPYFRADRLSRWLLRRLEASIVRDADCVVFVTRRTADQMMASYPDAWRGKVRVIPHGYDPDFQPLPGPPRPATAPLRLVYTGGFYGLRSPTTVLRALHQLNQERPLVSRLEVHFVGSGAPLYSRLSQQLGLEPVVQFQAPRPHREALRLAADADILLLIDAASTTESVFLPSKLVDYLLLRKPVLGITPAQGESADLLRRIGCPIAMPDDVPGIARAIGGLLRNRESGATAVSEQYDKVADEYDARATTRLFDVVLRDAQRSRRRAATVHSASGGNQHLLGE